MLRWKLFRYKSLAIAWFVLMCVLFFLPGSDLPERNWMAVVHFDKWVHIGLFAILIFLWRSSFNLDLNHYNWVLLLSTLLYGLSVEFIQKFWTSGRSFDLYDVLADMAGGVLGLLIWLRAYKKNKPL